MIRRAPAHPVVIAVASALVAACALAQPLPSWNDGPVKQAIAFGNSDGDWQMLQWTAAGERPRFMGLIHHTDPEREFAYDRNSKIGKLDKAWDDAKVKGWTVVDMKADWQNVFAFE